MPMGTVSNVDSASMHSMLTDTTAAVEACLALCAECFIGCIEGMVQYFNR